MSEHTEKDYRYALRGVSADKQEVHAAIKNLDKGLYPNAFCKILPDLAAGDPSYCNIMHADTAGTKTSLAYLYWRETGDLSVWAGIVQDAIVMNLDDMACVGCVNNIILSSTIGRNKHLVTGEVVATIIQAAQQFMTNMKQYGVNIISAGGETADVGDVVRTADVGFTAFARMHREDVLENNIQEGDVVVGFASYGQASYETEYNGGMGSNGLTSARHDVFHSEYATRYPETFDPNTDTSVVYTGTKKVTDTLSIDGVDIPIGKLVLSPTRTFLPVLSAILRDHRDALHGIIHNTGGGQTKVSKFLSSDLCVVKDNFLLVPPLFQLIQSESGTAWREMFQVFNMGCRLEIYTDAKTAEALIAIGKSFNIDTQIIGRVEARPGDTQVEIRSEYGNFSYHG